LKPNHPALLVRNSSADARLWCDGFDLLAASSSARSGIFIASVVVPVDNPLCSSLDDRIFRFLTAVKAGQEIFVAQSAGIWFKLTLRRAATAALPNATGSGLQQLRALRHDRTRSSEMVTAWTTLGVLARAGVDDL
jgi:hypothetical protein